MPLNLTLPGFGGGPQKQPAKGRIINATPQDPKKDAEAVFKEAVNPNTANRTLYDQRTRSGVSRTQERTMTDASGTVTDATTGSPLSRSAGVYKDDGGSIHQRSKLGMVTRALKKLTGW